MYACVDRMVRCARADEEVKAVQIMSAAMQRTPHSYTLLHVQSDFLRSKGQAAWALKLAREAVNCAPSEFMTWEKLTELYIDTKDYESVRRLSPLCPSLGDVRFQKALLTLNSCPMFTYNGKDVHRPIQTSRVHLPFKRQIVEILPEKQKTEDDEVCLDVSICARLIAHSPLSVSCLGRPRPPSPPSTWSPGYLGARLFPPHTPRL